MSKLCVITGATGHIGYALLKELLDSGEQVRILIRKDIPLFDGLDCEKARILSRSKRRLKGRISSITLRA